MPRGRPAPRSEAKKTKVGIADTHSSAEAPPSDIPFSASIFDLGVEGAGFGTLQAKIIEVSLQTLDGSTIAWANGGEDLELIVRARAEEAFTSPIMGFSIKDRMGQHLIGDNTYLATDARQQSVAAGQVVESRFRFKLPFFKSGEYIVSAAIASGSLEQHTQLHWLHEALLLKVNSRVQTGVMIGWPMAAIEFRQVLGRWASRIERGVQRAVVEVIEFPAHRHALRQPRHDHAVGSQPLRQVMRGRLAFDGNVQRENDLVDLAFGYPLDQPRDGKVFRLDAVERRQRSAQYMVQATIDAAFLDRPQMPYLFYDAQALPVAARIGAQRARIARIEIAAQAACDNGARCLRQRFRPMESSRHPCAAAYTAPRAVPNAGPAPAAAPAI